MDTRKRKQSLSSILKTQSPSRTALLDLNPNLNGPPNDETTHLDVQAEKKKKRRSSRRVSFAETYQVKEFMKDSDRKELGLWDDSHDETTHQELPDLKQASNPCDTAAPSIGCLDQPHHITGLETLLSGPIKQEAHSMTSSEQEPYTTSHINQQSTSSAGHQHTHDPNPSQQKNDINETNVKSSFLKSFIAADSCGGKGSFTTDLNAFAAPPTSQSYLPLPGQQQEQVAQEEPPQESSFRSSFLQAFVAAGPSFSGSEVPGSLKPNTEQNVDPGMELTNCYYSSEVPIRREVKEENIGDVTRIFGGQGDGFENENGMDMTTCIGGFDTFHRKLDRPAAESTRIFNSENTDNMDFTACIGGMSTRRSLGSNLNQTGTNMNFTQAFGKISESDYAKVPLDSTATLLQKLDAAIAGSDGSVAQTSSYIDTSKTSNVNILHQTKDNTRKSIALDTIQEVSSSTGSMLNVTSGDRSSASAPTPLDACVEEDEMDITTCSNYTRDVRSKPVQQELSRIPDNEDTGAMEMTCAIGNSVQALGPCKVVSSSVQEIDMYGDHTKVYDPAADDSAEMEMTCAMNQPLVTASQAKGGLSRFPAAFDEDKTRVFNSEDTAAMEMTCVMDGANSAGFSVQNVHRGSLRLPSSDKENAPSDPGRAMAASSQQRCADRTRVFDSAADDSAEIEMTCAINQPLVTDSWAKEVPSAAPTPTCNGDKTRVFDSDDTAAKEMTCVIDGSNSSAFSVQNIHRGSMLSSIKGSGKEGPGKEIPPSIKEKDNREDHTRVFNDSGEMEMTCAISQPLITGTGSQTKGELSRLPVAFDEDKTKIFTSDDTAAMEMTCAMNEPSIRGSQIKEGLSVWPTAFHEDRTRVFNSEDTAAMEMTCVMSAAKSSGFSVQNMHQGKMLSSSQKENTLSGFSHLVNNGVSRRADDTTHFESTECFGDLPEGLAYQMRRKKEQQGADNLQSDVTAHMEMTECVGEPVNNIISEEATNHQISKSNEGINGDKTCYFTSDNGDNMQMTECLDEPTGGPRPIMVKPRDHEQTKHFLSEDTGNMEMTTCVGALQTVPNINEKTHIFNNEDTGHMEMTCVGGAPTSTSNATKKSLEELKQIQTADTASMEMTARVGSFPSLSSTLNVSEQAVEPLTSDFVDKTLPNFSTSDDTTKKNHAVSDISAVTFPGVAGNMEHPVKGEDDPMQQQRPQVLEERKQQRNGEINISGDILHDKTSDTYTLSNPPLEMQEDHQTVAELAVEEKPLEGRNSDTFTINASAIAGAGKRKLSLLTEGNTTSHSSNEDQTKSDGEGSSSSPDMESQASFAMKDSIVLPDWIDADDEKGILEELPIDNDNTEDLCLMSTKRPRMDESCFTSSQMDASCLTSNLSHLPMSSSESGASSVADFLQTFFQFTDRPVGKRSIMVPTKVNEPTTLGGYLENACLIKPKADMYEWAIKFLTPTVEELRKSVRTQETKHLEENAPIIKEMQSADPERCAEIIKKGKSLQKYCTASSKAKMKEWRLQMVKNTRAAMEESHEHLENKVTKLTSSLSTIEEQLQQLASVDGELDDAISSLEQVKLPTEEEKSEWLVTSQRLTSLQTKLQEEEMIVQETESERQRLEAEIKCLEESRTKLEIEQQELNSRLGTGSRQEDQELDYMRSEIIFLNSVLEWRLQAFHENNYEFSFLNKSILLSMQYGDTESGGKLNDLSLCSLLADDACCSAKLAHSLFFSSICADKLKTLYPALVGLPQMMQHLSELAGQVRSLEAEVNRIDFWHPVTTAQSRLSIEFSCIEAHSMFRIHLDLVPGQYPLATIPHSCTIKIGKISEESINATMDAVQPGWQYISRITKAIEQLIIKHSS